MLVLYAASDVGAFYAMKAVLSYFHSQLNSEAALDNVFYLLMLPMLQVMSKYLSKWEHVFIVQFLFPFLILIHTIYHQ